MCLITLGGYLLASFSSSVQISRLIYGSDIREYGSGNPGATNILRIFGWKAALAVFIVDVGKGGISALLAPRLQFADVSFPPGLLQFVAGAAAVIGHCYPLFAEFRGGKGVATAAGALLVTHPVAVALCSGVFMAVLIASRKVSVAAMVASLSMPVLLLMLRHRFGYEVPSPNLWIATGLAVFIVFTHRSNIVRLWSGNEGKLGAGG